MSRVYKFQTYLRIELTTGVAISNPEDVLIFYKKPSGTIGSVAAQIGDPTTGVIYYDVEPDSSGNEDFLDEVGEWKFWAWVQFSDGRTARGETVTQEIFDNQDEC